MHALVGENGAGKSTLMKILYGMQKPDEGTIAVDGEQVTFSSPADAIARGIGMVHQHFMLADNLTVLENVVLGSEKLYGIGGTARKKIREISDRYGLGVRPDAWSRTSGSPTASAWRSSRSSSARPHPDPRRADRGARAAGGRRALRQPARAEVRGPVRHLHLPQAGRGPLRRRRHHRHPARHDRRHGRPVQDHAAPARRDDGRSELPTPETAESTVTDQAVLTVAGLTVFASGGASLGTEAEPTGGITLAPEGGEVKRVLDDVSFTIHAGEVMGIAGVEGNGQTELIDALIGTKNADSGTIAFLGEDITPWSTRKRRESGVGYIPEDRHRQGLLLEAPLWENRILGHVTEAPNAKGFWLNPKGAQDDTRRIVEEFDVRTPGIDVTAASLSGGNQQKLIVGREMSHNPKFLIAAHPTRGVDVGAQAQIWDRIREARREGLAVLLISADLDELIGLSDTLRVIYNGRLVADATPPPSPRRSWVRP